MTAPHAPQPVSGLQPRADAQLASTPSAPVLRPDPARRLSQAPRKKPRHGLYAAAWAVIGLFAGSYVFTLLLRHDGGALLARGEREDSVRTQTDVAHLQQKVGQLETDMARVKIDQAQADEREKQLVQRVGGVETRVEAFSVQIAQASANVAAAAKQPKTAPQVLAAEKQAGARIATGALPAAEVKNQREVAQARQAVPVAPEPAGDAAGILLARGPSLDALRLSWSLLNERHKGTLKSFEPRVVEVEPGTYQLIAGPVSNPAEALKVCASLKARGVACQPSDFKGSAL